MGFVWSISVSSKLFLWTFSHQTLKRERHRELQMPVMVINNVVLFVEMLLIAEEVAVMLYV